jgi:hypothetical protein
MLIRIWLSAKNFVTLWYESGELPEMGYSPFILPHFPAKKVKAL